MLLENDYNNILSRGQILIQSPDGKISTDFISDGDGAFNLIPGSFNPLHSGHRNIFFNLVKRLHLRNVYFEVSIERIGKQSFSYEQMCEILEQFQWFAPVIITNAPRFYDKIELFKQFNRKVNYFCGYDTGLRLIQQYELNELEGFDTSFFILPRGDSDGSVKTIKDLPIKPKNFFTISDFQTDSKHLYLSSTKLRMQNGIV